MNELKRQAIEKIRTHLKSKDLEEVARMPLRNGENKCYSLSTVRAVALGNRDNEALFQILLNRVEEKLTRIREKVNKIEELANGH